MNEQIPYHRWLNNPERRVGRIQRLRTMAAAVGASDSRYHEYKEQLESERRQPTPTVPGPKPSR